jgi:hypothetical protein
MSALRLLYPSRSEPDRLRMTLGELKPCKINENEGSGLQLACCAPGLTTPGRAFRKVRGSLGGASRHQGIDQQISMKIHRISTKYKRFSSGRAERAEPADNPRRFRKDTGGRPTARECELESADPPSVRLREASDGSAHTALLYERMRILRNPF